MQSHLDVRTGSDPYPSPTLYGQAITIYKNLGVEIHVSELDATINDGNESYFTGQATYYKNIMNQILTNGGSAITAVVVWGIQDDQSWRKARKPLLFNASGAKKAAYNELVNLIPQSDWGKPGSNSSSSIVPSSSSSAKPSSSSVAVSSSSKASSSSTAASSSSKASSSSTAASSSSKASSSSTATSPSSSSLANSSSSHTATSSSSSDETLSSSSSEEEDITPILGTGLSIQSSQSITYYSIKGEPLGSAKPQKAGIYIIKQGYSVKKIVVR